MAQDTEVQNAVEMPATKAQAQAVLKRFKISGLKVESIGEDRIFCLTGPVLTPVEGGEPAMKRQARTIILVGAGDLVEAVHVRGWHVDDEKDWDLV